MVLDRMSVTINH